MQTSITSARVGLANATPPVFRSEKAIEIRNLVGTTDKPIDFFVHKIHEHLAASLIDYPLHETERGTGPSERIDESESGD
jgi:hypothetical protein